MRAPFKPPPTHDLDAKAGRVEAAASTQPDLVGVEVSRHARVMRRDPLASYAPLYASGAGLRRPPRG
jgi:hypothetical protein